MSQAKAKLSGYRQAPRKVRLIAGLVRGKSVDRALVELEHRAKRAAPVFSKLILSAVANAKALGLDEKSLTEPYSLDPLRRADQEGLEEGSKGRCRCRCFHGEEGSKTRRKEDCY